MTPSFDLDAYLDRIGWTGDVRPTLDALAGLLAAHTARIPFENLDVLLGRRVRLDLEGIQAKLVQARRGGYCFEHATLFAAVLERFGFKPLRHAARVVLFAAREASTRTHMFLTVALPEGRFVVDPGFGAFAARLPLPLVDSGAAQPAGATHWLSRDDRFWALRTLRDGIAIDAWLSTLGEENPADFQVANHYTATYPASPFVNGLMMHAFTAEGRVAVINRDATIWRGDTPQSIRIADRRALRALLVEHFGFDLPEVEHMRVPAIAEWA
jgi:N-hydroxyarylamine O-acetyltransferase